jgi:hypothetical protein
MRRKAVPGRARTTAQVHSFPAPVRGWVTNESLARSGPAGARILDNFVPEEFSIRPRKGALLRATVANGDPCEAFIVYRSATASQIFAATATDIFDVSNPVSQTAIPAAVVTDQTSGDYTSVNFATAGGEFALAVNGEDRALYFDGSDWRRIDDATHELPYDGQTGNFTVGMTVTGGTSGATGVIVEDIDGGAAGTLRLKTVTGTFQDNEAITDTGTGAAMVNVAAVQVPAITGVTTDLFSHVWLFKSRLFFVKANSLVAHYLPVDSLGGAAGTISLRGVFQEGGKLLFGATWSTDAGDGMDDVCVFVSDQGEVAIYQGTDPGDANLWLLSGVYRIGRPLHKNAWMKAGGDLLIATREGFVPVSSSVRRDRAALALDAVTRPIEPTWRAYVKDRPGQWSVTKSVALNYSLIGFPLGGGAVDEAFIVNNQTGAWARFSGWSVNCGVEFDDLLYFGTADGKVMQAEETGSDNGELYTCLYLGMPEHLGSVVQEKTALMTRATWQASTEFNFKAGFAFDYNVTIGAYPSAAAITPGPLWDVAEWDVAVWDGAGIETIRADWQSTSGRGFTVAPIVQMTFGDTAAADVKLISVDLTYETGAIVT